MLNRNTNKINLLWEEIQKKVVEADVRTNIIGIGIYSATLTINPERKRRYKK